MKVKELRDTIDGIQKITASELAEIAYRRKNTVMLETLSKYIKLKYSRGSYGYFTIAFKFLD